MIEVGKAINDILSNGLTGRNAHPEFSQNDFGDTYIVYQIVNNTPSDTKDFVSTLDEVEVEISIYSKTFSEVASISATVRADLDRVAYGAYGGVNLNGVQYQDEDSGFDPISKRYECEQRYIFRVQRTILKKA